MAYYKISQEKTTFKESPVAMAKMLLLNLLLLVFCVPIYSQTAKLMLPIGHTQEVIDAVFSKDGNRVLTVSQDKTVKIWDGETGLLLASLKGHEGMIAMGVFSPDGNTILTVSEDRTARIWNSYNGNLIATIEYEYEEIYDAGFSEDGKYIYAPFSDSALRFFDAKNGKLLQTIKNPKAEFGWIAQHPDGNLIIATDETQKFGIWDKSTSKKIATLSGHKAKVEYVEYNKVNNKILSTAEDGIAIVWNLKGQKLFQITTNGNIREARFSPDGKYLFTYSDKFELSLWSADDGHKIIQFAAVSDELATVEFSIDSKRLVTTHLQSAYIWDIPSGKLFRKIDLLYGVINARFDNSCTKLVTACYDKVAMVWDLFTEEEILDLDGQTYAPTSSSFSPDGTKILTTDELGYCRIWNSATSQISSMLIGHTRGISSAEYSKDGTRIITASWDSTVKIWDANTAKVLVTLKGHKNQVLYAHLSPDGNKVITSSLDSTSQLWIWNSTQRKWEFKKRYRNPLGSMGDPIFSSDGNFILLPDHNFRPYLELVNANNGQSIGRFKGMGDSSFHAAFFTNDNKTVITVTAGGSNKPEQGLQYWSTADGRLIEKKLIAKDIYPNNIAISPDGTKMVYVTNMTDLLIINLSNFSIIKRIPELGYYPNDIQFHPSNNSFLMCFDDNSIESWDANTGNLLGSLLGHTNNVHTAKYSQDGGFILSQSEDNTFKKWDSQGQLLYTFFPIGEGYDYLVLDPYDRYDGTAEARKLLYFTCGTEVVALDQFKDLSWQPGLVSRIMGVSKEPITAKKSSEIQICNVTPFVQQMGLNNGRYEFQIFPKDGGVGMVQLFVNGKMRGEYAASTLPKKNSAYYLGINETDLKPYFVPGVSNVVSVKATVANGSMTSRGGEVETGVQPKSTATPNMYVVAIGINQYKGEKLKLNFASPDAEGFSAALSASAKKLLNTDGKQHVITSLFTTEKGNVNAPFKTAIKKRLEEIAVSSKAEDILVIFFAGHGALLSGQKNFYMLTAEASSLELNGVEKEVAISTDELNGWMRNIKANKQVLILDACNSGQANTNAQEMITKRDMPADQVRALENLKDKTGTFILSASASGQPAYEASQFGQGLLTYSLLSGIKLGNGLKDDKYLDVSMWFNSASNQVRDLAKSIGGRQEPQIIGVASFDLGLADKEVKDAINISPSQKKLFTRSLVYTGDRDLLLDNLQITDEFNNELLSRSSMGRESKLSYVEQYKSADAYSIRGSYEVTGNKLSLKVSVVYKNAKTGVDIIKVGDVMQKSQLIKLAIDEILNQIQK
ncbi:MAG: hypothetical protein B7Y15_08710 [Bacteroidetes bacterium 24-39-8]|nr:MAG: hypothetical protein B7Y15_08710 [Bacteroidetes bacterium 24-39-8]OZA64873.1 MAG: hypothetical protein B7X72_08180 [Sphingobacteriia bacterium 39-39-8]